VHQGVTGCASCHGSSVANTFANVTIVTTPANHIPIGALDCNGSGCHSTSNVNSGGFILGAANINSPTLNVAGHTTIASAVASCQTCHQTAAYLGMIASTPTAAGDSRPSAALDPSHPASGDCGSCHTSTPTFAGNVTNGAKPANHIPTNAPCAQCHTTPGNYAAYVMGATGHAGITSGCATCHADGLSFANMAPPTLVEPPTGPTGHIPIGSFACELCHSNSNFTTFSGTVMKHTVVRADTCETCHEYGMTWKTNTGVQLWTRPSPNHHAGQDCGGSGCHNPRDKRALRPRATSAGATQSAVKPPGHPATSNACSACHSASAWLPVVRIDHSQVIGTCVSCHSGTLARAMPATHIRTSAACSNCHTTNAWTPARFEHASVVAQSCASCHDSVHAIGTPANHVRTRESCSNCHGTFAWMPARLNHSRLAQPCAGCHDRGTATGMPVAHLRTRLDCGACHVYPDWLIVKSPPVRGRVPVAGTLLAPERMPRNATSTKTR